MSGTDTDSTPAAPAERVTRRRGAVALDDEPLLDAATAEFAAGGYRGTSMETIATAAAITKPTLYAHFGTKQALYTACLQREGGRLAAFLFRTYDAGAELSAEDQVATFLRATFEHVVAHPEGFRLLFDDTFADETGIRDGLRQGIIARIAEQIRAGARTLGFPAPGASADLVAAMIVGLSVFGAQQVLVSTPEDPDLAADLAAALVNTGLTSLPRELMAPVDRAATSRRPTAG